MNRRCAFGKSQRRESHKKYDWHYNPLAVPSIDFDANMVIAIFQGQCLNCAGLKAVAISEDDSRVVLKFNKKSPQTGGTSATDDGGRGSVRIWLLHLAAFQ